MGSIRIELPWPPSELSPNRRMHWAKLAKAKRLYRDMCHYSVQRGLIVPDNDLTLDLLFNPPTKRKYDRDNLVARLKSGIDGIADALKINDVRFVRLSAQIGNVVNRGAVIVNIY